MIGSFLSGHCSAESPPREFAALRRGTLFVLLIFASSQPLTSQEKLLPVFHFQQLRGLPSVLVFSNVVRDSSGYVWVGTVNGLCRYDGYTVKEYRSVELDPYSLPSNIVTSLYCDSRKRLWVGTSSGKISVYDHSRDRFLNLRQIQYDSSKINRGYFGRFLEDPNGNIWCTMQEGIIRIGVPARFNPDNIDSIAASVHFTTIPTGTTTKAARSLIARNYASFIAGTDSGLIAIDPVTLTVSRPRYSNQLALRLDSLSINCLALDPDGTVWVATKTEGLYRLDWDRGTAKNYRPHESEHHSIRDDDVLSIELDPRGNLWVASYGGVDLFSPVEGECIPYLTSGPAPGTGPAQRISVDCTGTAWFCTGAGVHWLSPRSLLLPHYSLANADGRLRSFESVERGRDGAIWCFSEGHLLETEMSTMTIVSTIDVFRGKPQRFYETPDRTVSLLDPHGNFWYAAYDRGLYKVNLHSRTINNYDYQTNRSSVGIRSIAQGPGDSLWIGTEPDGLFLFDPARGTFHPSGLNLDLVIVHKARDGSLWISTEGGGLFVYQRATGELTRFVHNGSNPHSLSDNVTRVTYEDPAGRIWVGTGKGIDLWDPARSSFILYPNPLFDDALFALPIGADATGRVWIRYLSHGLSLLDPVNGKFTNLDSDNGLCGSPTDMQILDDGRVLLAGRTGVNIVRPDSLHYSRPPPPLLITLLRVNDTLMIPVPDVVGSRRLQFSHNENVLEFMFAALDIDAPQLVEYGYRLDGLETEWIKPADRRYVRYTALSPGDYTFRVRAKSSWGEWPEREIACVFSIAPPWWQSLWAYACYLLFTAALLFAIYRVRLNQERLKQRVEMEHLQAEHLVEVDRMKSRFFANISHEFRTPLTLVLGPIRKWRERDREEELTNDMGLAERNATRLLSLVNQLLDLSKIEAGAMSLRVRPANIVPIVKGIARSFESSAGSRKIDLEVAVPVEDIEVYVDRDKLEKVLSNLLSNAFKFTAEGGKVLVTVRIFSSFTPLNPESETKVVQTNEARAQSGEFVEIAVRDTGIGIPVESLRHIFDRFYQGDNSETRRFEGSGIGLALVKELVDLHHGRIYVQSEEGKGSEFTVRLPLGRNHLKEEEIAPESDDEHGRTEGVFGSDLDAGHEDPRTGGLQGDEPRPIVLIVEDNADVRTYVREHLNSYQVLESRDGIGGIETAREVIPDLIISDVMMPGKDGYELCRTLKTDEKTSHIPIILLTAKAGSEDKIEGLETGADDYLAKPFEPKELVARVRNLIESRRRLQKRFTVPLKPGEIAVTSMDDAFLMRAIGILNERLSDENFGVDELGSALNMSRSQLHRKLTALTSQSTGEFIRYMRLHRAKDLLERGAGTVAEIAFSVGFSDPSHFSRRFHRQFGVTPSDLRNRAP